MKFLELINMDDDVVCINVTQISCVRECLYGYSRITLNNGINIEVKYDYTSIMQAMDAQTIELNDTTPNFSSTDELPF